MKNKKYCIVLIILSLLLTISLINIDRNLDSWPVNDKIHLSSKPMQQVLFKVGVLYGPNDLDPHDAWDSNSFYVIDQVCEGLFAHNLSDPDNSIIPNLALLGTWNPAGTEYTCILRQNVKFHDGTAFNADAVIWNWDRMSWMMNTTGTNMVEVTQIAELYTFPDGVPIVSNITRNGDYNVTFNLARPYIPFKALLCFSGSYILSPLSTPATAYIDTATGDIVGTGPFVYDNYTSDVEVNFHAFDNYWRGKANITEMRFQIITDTNVRHAALLAGDIHFLKAPMSSWYSTFKSSPDITFLNTSTTSHLIQCLGMNNQRINRTLREAISYAIDYDYIINELREGQVVRLKSPIPNGVLYANDTFEVPTLNITRARLVMQSMGFGTTFTTDAEWVAVAAGATPFLTVNYTYNIGNKFRKDCFLLLEDNMAQIGIKVEDAELEWGPYLDRLLDVDDGWDKLEIWWVGWIPDYNDPSNLINTLFTNSSTGFNNVQYNGYTAAIEAGRDPMALNDNVQLLMEEGLSEIDPFAREALYDRIQELLIEHDRPWAWGYVSYVYHAYNKHLTGFQQNAMRKIYFYPCVWNYTVSLILPSPFTLSSDAGSPDANGDFNLTWTPSTFADNYSLYVHSNLITEINDSLTLLLDEVTDLSYEAFDYSDGTYFFAVVAKNINGTILSNNIEVIVEIEEPGPAPWILGFELWTMLFTISSVGFILLLRKKKKITQ